VGAAIDVALGDPAYTRYSNLPPRVTADEIADLREKRGESGEAACWAILSKTRQIIGIFELWYRDQSAGALEAGYWIRDADRRKGYGSEALRLVTEWVGETSSAQRIELAIHQDNEPSLRLAAAAGYRHAGPCTPSVPGVDRTAPYELYLWEADPSQAR
jgi:RimJ/RimL family protein N-acetyltransferase